MAAVVHDRRPFVCLLDTAAGQGTNVIEKGVRSREKDWNEKLMGETFEEGSPHQSSSNVWNLKKALGWRLTEKLVLWWRQ